MAARDRILRGVPADSRGGIAVVIGRAARRAEREALCGESASRNAVERCQERRREPVSREDLLRESAQARLLAGLETMPGAATTAVRDSISSHILLSSSNGH